MAKGSLEKITKLCNFFAGLFNKIVKEVHNLDPKDNTKQRIISGLVMIPVAVYAIFYSRSVFLFAKFIFACNEAPNITDKSHGLNRRFIVINMNKRYEYGVNANPYLSQELAEETPGIITKFRNCYKELAARG